MFTQEDETYLAENGFIVEPSQSPIRTTDLEEIAKNRFIFLESERFLVTEFIKFPDEIRVLHHETGDYECFGKSLNEYFVISKQNNGVYLISSDPNYSLISRINLNLKTFIATFHYFLMAMHNIIADYKLVEFNGDENEFNDKRVQLFEQIANNFVNQVKLIDNFAIPEGKMTTFWRTAYHKMLEADLGFHLYNVSLFDYMETGRWGNID